MNDAHLFSLAREESLKSDYSGCGSARVGTVVVYKGTVLAKGYNSNVTHTYQDLWNVKRFKNTGNGYLPAKLHSEINCLRKIRYLDIDFSRVHVYNYRELRDGTIAMSRPCPSCMAALKSLGIKHIHYTTLDGYAHERLN